MLEKIKDYDLVLGSRYLRGVRVNNWAFRRLIMSKFANLYVQFVGKLPIEDSTGDLSASGAGYWRLSIWTRFTPTATASRSR